MSGLWASHSPLTITFHKAGVIDVDALRAVITLRDLAATGRRPALFEIPHRPHVTGQQTVAVLGPVGAGNSHAGDRWVRQ